MISRGDCPHELKDIVQPGPPRPKKVRNKMASKVNTKFVVVLSVVMLVLAGGGALIGYQAIKKSGNDHEKLGDQFAAAGDWAKAISHYSQAVNKDQRNAAFIKKWIGALEKHTPSTRQSYVEAYKKEYFGAALKGLSDAEPSIYESQRKFLNEWYQYVLRLDSSDLGSWEAVVDQTNGVLDRFNGDAQSKKLLTRFRGLARAQAVALKGERTDDQIKTAKDDLLLALEADPADEESMLAAVALDSISAQRARDKVESAKVTEYENAASKRLQDFIKANPNAATARVRWFMLQFAEAGKSAPPGTTVKDLVGQLLTPLTDAVEAFERIPPEKVDGRQAINLALAGAEALDVQGARLRAVLDKAAKAQSGNARFLNEYAALLLNLGKIDEAVAVCEQVIKMPMPPVSLAGIELIDAQPQALLTQSEAMFLGWQVATTAKDAAKAAPYIERAKGYRDALAQMMGQDYSPLSLIDAKLKYVTGDVSAARSLISRYNEQTQRRNAAGMMLEGEIMNALGNTGAAKSAFERVIEIQPRNLRALTMLGQIALNQGNYSAGSAYIGAAAALSPNDENLRKLAADAAKAAKGDDPVLRQVMLARQMATGVNPDIPGAIKILEKAARDNNDPPQVMAFWADLLMRNNRSAEAMPIVDRGLAKTPSHTGLQTLKSILSGGGTLDAELKRIDESLLTDTQRLMQKYLACLRAGKEDRAKAFFDEAKRLAPDDPMLLDIMFVNAMTTQDTKEMDRIVKVAEEKNLDQINGLSFRARRDIAESQRLKALSAEKEKAGDLPGAKEQRDEALAMLKSSRAALSQMVTVDKTNPVGWRLLGAVEMELAMLPGGDRNGLTAASDAFGRALAIRPDDVVSINYQLKAMIQNGQLDQALVMAREKEIIAGSDEDFRRTWLLLESTSAQGDKGKAVRVRKDILAREPDNVKNMVALTYLYMEQRQWDDAKDLVAKIKAHEGMELDATNLLGQLHLRQGEAKQAVAVFRDYAESVPEAKRTVSTYLVAARNLVQAGLINEALEFYTLAKPYQDKTQREVDREIGDTLYQAGGVREAIDVYKSVLDAGYPDPEHLVRARVAEGYLSLGDAKNAGEVLDQVGPRISESASLLVLSARVTAGLGDKPKARRLLDQAVAVAKPSDPVPFVARADFNITDPALMRDAEQDYKEAVRRMPGYDVARIRLGNLYFVQGNYDAMLQQYREAVAAAPDNNNMRVTYVQTLLNMGRNDEAVIAVEDTIKSRPDDVTWLLMGSQLMTQVGKKARAVDLAKAAFEKQKELTQAGVYIKALLNLEPPDISTAMKVIAVPELKVNTDIGARLLRARIRLAEKKPDVAFDDMKTAAGLLDQSQPEMVRMYFSAVGEVYTDPKDRAALVNKLEAIRPFAGWMRFFASTVRIEEPTTRDRAIADLRDLGDNSPEEAIKFMSRGLIGVQRYKEGKAEEAVLMYKSALELAPNDPEMNNNLAYVLGSELGRAEEALPYAQKAVAGSPRSAAVLDTYATLLTETGKLAEAEQWFIRAIQVAPNEADRFPVFLHYGLLKLKQGDRTAATRLWDQVKTMLNNNKELGADHARSLRTLEDGVTK